MHIYSLIKHNYANIKVRSNSEKSTEVEPPVHLSHFRDSKVNLLKPLVDKHNVCCVQLEVSFCPNIAFGIQRNVFYWQLVF